MKFILQYFIRFSVMSMTTISPVPFSPTFPVFPTTGKN